MLFNFLRVPQPSQHSLDRGAFLMYNIMVEHLSFYGQN